MALGRIWRRVMRRTGARRRARPRRSPGPLTQNGGADQSADSWHVDDGDGDDDVLQVRAEDGDKTDADQDGGEGEDGIEEAADHAIDHPAEIARGQSQGNGINSAACDREDRHPQRDARPEEDAGEDIAAEVVGAERVRGGGREGHARADGVGIGGGEPAAEDGGQQQTEDEQTDQARAIVDESVKGLDPEGAWLGRLRVRALPVVRLSRGIQSRGRSGWARPGNHVYRANRMRGLRKA